MDATVRPAKHSDEAGLFALTVLFPTPTPAGLDAFRRALQVKLEDAASALLVAELNERLVGYVSGSCHVTFYAAGMTAWVDEILVAPDCRGKGVGKRLVSEFETWSTRQQCVLVALATRGAAGFYERLGYTSTAGYFKKYLDDKAQR
jgi:GNAT superfamily N-acetyltransferase